MVNSSKSEIVQNVLHCKEWRHNANKGADAIFSYLVLRKRGRNFNFGKIEIGIDRRKVSKDNENTIKK